MNTLSVLPVILGLVAGAIAGSFVNMMSYRLPLMIAASEQRLNLFFPSSHCPGCGQSIKILHKVPVISYLFLHGRCAYCRQAIGRRYLIIECIAAAAGGWLAFSWPGLVAGSAVAMALTIALALAVIDWEHMILPDELNYLLLWTGLLVNAFDASAIGTLLQDAVYGALAGYASLWLVHHAYYLVRRRDGLGLGDLKLLAAWGAWLGWQLLPAIIVIASAGALGLALTRALLRRPFDWQQPIPFGPWLVLGGSIALLARLWG